MTSHSKTRMLLLGAALLIVAVGAFLFVSNAPRGEPSAVEPAAVEELAVAEPEALSAAADEEDVAVAPEPLVPPVEPTPKPTSRTPEPEPSPDLIEFSPLPPNWVPPKLEYGSVLVRVVDSSSRKPVSNFNLWLSRDSGSPGLDTARTPMALTDERGECRFERVPAGLVEIRGAPAVSRGLANVISERESVVSVSVSLTVLLKGTVLDRNGKRVVNAGVFELEGASHEWVTWGPIARTDGHGDYVARVRRYPAEPQLCAVADGFMPSAVQHLNVGPFDHEPELNFTLGGEGASITIRVVDVDGRPVSDAHIDVHVVFARNVPGIPADELEAWDRNFKVLWSTVTDSNGRAELRGLPRRDFRVTARAAGFAPVLKGFSLTGERPQPPRYMGSVRILEEHFESMAHGDSLTLRLEAGITVEGRVCSPAGVPAAFAVVHSHVKFRGISRWVHADEEGFFRISNVSPELDSLTAHLDGRTARIDASAFPTRRPAIWNPVLE